MAPHSSTLAWKIPWAEEPGRLQSMGSRRVGHDWATSLSLFTFMHWRRKWQPTPVFLPGKSQGRGSLVGCCLWGRTESDTTEVTYQGHGTASTIDTCHFPLCAIGNYSWESGWCAQAFMNQIIFGRSKTERFYCSSHFKKEKKKDPFKLRLVKWHPQIQALEKDNLLDAQHIVLLSTTMTDFWQLNISI